MFNKSFEPADYQALTDEVGIFEYCRQRCGGNIQHTHRAWESGIALKAIREAECDTVLEIGSGGSLFAPMVAQLGYQISVVDPADSVNMAHFQGEKLGKLIYIYQQDFMTANIGKHDVVACLSVIEHVDDDEAFFIKMLNTATKLIVLTTDFSMDGGKYSPDHLRTYSPDDLWYLVNIAHQNGWELLSEPAWEDHGAHVFAYNFASLCLRKSSDGI